MSSYKDRLAGQYGQQQFPQYQTQGQQGQHGQYRQPQPQQPYYQQNNYQNYGGQQGGQQQQQRSNQRPTMGGGNVMGGNPMYSNKSNQQGQQAQQQAASGVAVPGQGQSRQGVVPQANIVSIMPGTIGAASQQTQQGQTQVSGVTTQTPAQAVNNNNNNQQQQQSSNTGTQTGSVNTNANAVNNNNGAASQTTQATQSVQTGVPSAPAQQGGGAAAVVAAQQQQQQGQVQQAQAQTQMASAAAQGQQNAAAAAAVSGGGASQDASQAEQGGQDEQDDDDEQQQQQAQQGGGVAAQQQQQQQGKGNQQVGGQQSQASSGAQAGQAPNAQQNVGNRSGQPKKKPVTSVTTNQIRAFGSKHEIKCDETFAYYDGYIVDYDEQKRQFEILYERDWKPRQWVNVEYVRKCAPDLPANWRPSKNDRVECKAKAETNEPYGWWTCFIRDIRGELYVIDYEGWEEHHDVMELRVLRPLNPHEKYDDSKQQPIEKHETDMSDIVNYEFITSNLEQLRLIAERTGLIHLGFRPDRHKIVYVGYRSQISNARRLFNWLVDVKKRHSGSEEENQRKIKDLNEQYSRLKNCVSVHFDFNRELIGFVIGKGGENVRAAKDIDGVEHINVDTDKCQCLILAQTPEALANARDQLEIVKAVVPIPRNCLPSIIGPQGSNVQTLEQTAGVFLISTMLHYQTRILKNNDYGMDIDFKSQEMVDMVVIGPKLNVELATDLLDKDVQHHNQLQSQNERAREVHKELRQRDYSYENPYSYYNEQQQYGGGNGGADGGDGNNTGGGGGGGWNQPSRRRQKQQRKNANTQGNDNNNNNNNNNNNEDTNVTTGGGDNNRDNENDNNNNNSNEQSFDEDGGYQNGYTNSPSDGAKGGNKQAPKSKRPKYKKKGEAK